MAQPTGGIEDSIHNPGTKSHAWRPNIFSGDRKTLEIFFQDNNIYVESNIKDFPDGASKSQFLLSYIDRGEAECWKEFYIDTNIKQADGSYKWLKIKDLVDNLRANFTKGDEVEESLRKLKTMKQGNRMAEEVVNEFRILKAQAKIDDSPLSVRMFQQVLNPSLTMKILTDIDKSNTLEDTRTATNAVDKYGWFSKAIQYDQIYRDTWAAQKEDWGSNYNNNNENKNWNFRQAVQRGNERSWCNNRPAPYRDPNAMDIDVVTTINAMTYEEQGEYLKKGLCFNCKQPRHLSHDCPKKNPRRSTSNGVGPPSYIRNQSYSKKPDAKEVAKYICAMNKEEQDDDLSNKGKDFWNGEQQACWTSTLQIM